MSLLPDADDDDEDAAALTTFLNQEAESTTLMRALSEGERHRLNAALTGLLASDPCPLASRPTAVLVQPILANAGVAGAPQEHLSLNLSGRMGTLLQCESGGVIPFLERLGWQQRRAPDGGGGVRLCLEVPAPALHAAAHHWLHKLMRVYAGVQAVLPALAAVCPPRHADATARIANSPVLAAVTAWGPVRASNVTLWHGLGAGVNGTEGSSSSSSSSAVSALLRALQWHRMQAPADNTVWWTPGLAWRNCCPIVPSVVAAVVRFAVSAAAHDVPRALLGPAATQRLAAVRAVTEYCEDAARDDLVLVRMWTVPALLTVLRNAAGDQEVAQEACQALRNLACVALGRRHAVAHGAVDALVPRMAFADATHAWGSAMDRWTAPGEQRYDPRTLQWYAADALRCCLLGTGDATHDGALRRLVGARVVQPVVDLLHSGGHRRSAAAALVTQLCCYGASRQNQVAYARARALSVLMDMTDSNDATVAEAGLRALCSVTWSCPEAQEALAQAMGVDLIQVHLSHARVNMRILSADALAALCAQRCNVAEADPVVAALTRDRAFLAHCVDAIRIQSNQSTGVAAGIIAGLGHAAGMHVSICTALHEAHVWPIIVAGMAMRGTRVALECAWLTERITGHDHTLALAVANDVLAAAFGRVSAMLACTAVVNDHDAAQQEPPDHVRDALFGRGSTHVLAAVGNMCRHVAGREAVALRDGVLTLLRLWQWYDGRADEPSHSQGDCTARALALAAGLERNRQRLDRLLGGDVTAVVVAAQRGSRDVEESDLIDVHLGMGEFVGV